MSTNSLSASLSEIFGFTSFRPNQEEIVAAIMAGQDVFAVMPTGGGKSLCYQLPACLKPGVCVVVSPLISLMKDQVDAANANGIGAASLNSSLSESEKSETYRLVRSGAVRLLYISPERFNSPGFIEYLKTLNLSFFAVDEAHCISEWGHDFRPDYLSLANMIREFPGVPVSAFTATATPRVADDIVARLGLRHPHLTRASFNRHNLFYRIQPKENLEKQLMDFLRERNGETGIIYRTTRKNVEATTALLKKNGIDARSYHAGMSDEERKRAQEDFRRDRCQVVVATIAFGMGIDKPNVRFVVHGDLPKNLEGYYQETGRAGRDGEPAFCVLFHNMGDVAQLLRFNSGIEDPVAREAAQHQLNRMISFARTDRCRRAALLEYFGETYPQDNCGGCDICMGEVEREEATIPAQKALSAMVRTGNRFGANHLADLLVGASTEKIRQNGHDRLPTYGVGRDKDKSYWRRVIEALLAKGLASIEDSQYPIPRVTDEGWKVLRGQATFEMLRIAEKKGRTRKSAAELAALPFNKNLFARLRKLRARLAEESNVPPYVVFVDRALQDMARVFPQNDAEMLTVSGVGMHKLKVYGSIFMEEIAKYLQEHPEDRPERPREVEGSGGEGHPPERERRAELVSTETVTLQLLSEGLSLEQVAERRGLKPETIAGHIEKLVKSGNSFPSERFIQPERLETIRKLFVQAGTIMLKPVVEASNGDVSYLEARIARIFL